MKGKTWVDHEWLINLFSFWVHNKLGYISLNIFFAALIILTLMLLSRFTEKYFLNNNKPTILIIFFQTFGVWAMLPHLGVRMQEVTLLFLLLLLIIIHKYNKDRDKKILFFTIPLFYLWSCVHAGFLIGIFIMFCYLGIKIVEKIILKTAKLKNILNISPLTTKELTTFFIFIIFSIIATMFTPYGLELYGFLSGYTDSYYLTNIQEWLPATHYPFQYVQITYLAIATAFTSIFIYEIISKKLKTKMDLWQLFLLILFLYLAFKSRRHFPLFFVVSFPILISISKQLLGKVPPFIKKIQQNPIVIIASIAAMLSIALMLIIKTNYTENPFYNETICRNLPCRAVEFLKENPELSQGRIFNNYGWGGYMIWVWPEKKLFIDGRLPQFQYGEHTMLEEYNSFFEEENVETKLQEHNIELILMSKTKKPKINWFERHFLTISEEDFGDKAEYMMEYLNTSSEWRQIYSDNISVIYSKNN